MKEKIENYREYFTRWKYVTIDRLFWYFYLTFFSQILALNWDWHIITIALFDLHDHTNCHRLVSEGHFNYFVKHWATKDNGFYWAHWIHSTNFNQSELLNMVVTDQHIVFVATNTGRLFIDSYLISMLVYCVVCTKKLFLPLRYFGLR